MYCWTDPTLGFGGPDGEMCISGFFCGDQPGGWPEWIRISFGWERVVAAIRLNVVVISFCLRMTGA